MPTYHGRVYAASKYILGEESPFKHGVRRPERDVVTVVFVSGEKLTVSFEIVVCALDSRFQFFTACAGG